MLALLFLCILPMTQAQTTISARVFEIPQQIDVVDIPQPHRLALYDEYPELRDVDKGVLVETREEVIIDEMLSRGYLCDVEKYNNNEALWPAYVYTPAICTNSCRAGAAITLGGRALVHPCEERYGPAGQCCPVSENTFFFERFQDAFTATEQREPAYPFHKGTVVPSVDIRRLTAGQADEDKEALSDIGFIQELSEELVCGVRLRKDYTRVDTPRGTVEYTANNRYLWFYCLEPSACEEPDAKSDYHAEEEWNDFCQYRLHRAVGEKQRKKSKCCHPKHAERNYFSRKLQNWEFPQLPLFLQYAPGVRSNFMCDVYSRYTCSGFTDNCDPEPEKYPLPEYLRPSYPGEFPHFTHLGVLAPKLVLFHCTGTVISRRYILSTWKCRSIHGYSTNVALVGFKYKDYVPILSKGRQNAYVIKSIRNPYLELYSPMGSPPLLYEPTLYQTNKDIIFNSKIWPACIYYRRTERADFGVYPFMGVYYNGTSNKEYLRKADMELTGHPDAPETLFDGCRDKKLYVYSNAYERNPYSRHGVQRLHEFCAFPVRLFRESPQDGDTLGPCKYEKGGALVERINTPHCMWRVLGVLSNTRVDCTRNMPFVFHNITYFVNMIEDIVWPNAFLDADLPELLCNNGAGHPDSTWRKHWDTSGEPIGL